MSALSLKAFTFWSTRIPVISQFLDDYVLAGGSMGDFEIIDLTMLEGLSDPALAELWVIYYVLWKVTETQGGV